MAAINLVRALFGTLVLFSFCTVLLQILKIGKYSGPISPQTSQQQQRSYDLKEHTEIYRDYFHERTLNKSYTTIFIFSAFIMGHSSSDQSPSFSIAEETLAGRGIVEKLSKTRDNIKRQKAGDQKENTTVRQEEPPVIEVRVNGWEHEDYHNLTLKCCYLWETDEVSEFLNPMRFYYIKGTSKKDHLLSLQFKCLYRSRFLELQGVHIQTQNNSCETVKQRFVKPMLPHRPKYNGMIAVCLKIIFGSPDPRWLIEWIEHYKELKVDKVFLTTYNISVQVHKVIQYYVTEGFVEAVPFDFPLKNSKPRFLGQKNFQAWSDEQLVVFDFSTRYKEYSFTSVLDLDEFLVPAEGDMKTLMSRLMVRYPDVGAFVFNVNLILMSWGKYPMYGNSVVSQFIQGTYSVMTRWKHLDITNRTVLGRGSTHFSTLTKGHRTQKVPPELAVINHYRKYCYNDLKHVCNGTRLNHTNILRVIKKTDQRSFSVAKRLELA